MTTTGNEGNHMKQLSHENEIRAAETLAHYLKENVPLADASAREDCERVARNIRAAFEALEGGDAAREGSRESALDTRPYEAQALATLLGRDDTWGHSIDCAEEAVQLVNEAFTKLSRRQASSNVSRPTKTTSNCERREG